MNPQEVGATEWLANLSIATIVGAAFVLTIVRIALTPYRTALARSIAELVESLTIAGVLVFLIIRPFFVQAFYIPSESMEPTLAGHEAGASSTRDFYPESVHDHIFVYKLGYRLGEPLHGDIIVFRAERKADTREPKQENVLIKRLVGLPGDKIEVKPDATGVVRVYRNGEQLVEPYTKEPMNDTRDGRFGVTRPIVLGRDELFVMGDNRNNSNDSRYWGPLPRDRVIGQAVLTFWPLNRLRWLK